MNKNMKKVLVVGVLGMFVLMFVASLVSAPPVVSTSDNGGWTISIGKTGGVHQPIENPEWLFSAQEFFGLGETWADMIIALSVVLIIFAASFDIIGLTSFGTDWVKYLISGGIAVAFGVSGGVGLFAVTMVKITGGSVMIGTFVTIIIGVGLLISGTWIKGRLSRLKSKQTAEEVKGAMKVAAATNAGDVAKGYAAAKAAEDAK